MAFIKIFFFLFLLGSVSNLHCTEANKDRLPFLIDLTRLPADHPLAVFGKRGYAQGAPVHARSAASAP
ncbi:hypothetical protein U1Q18_002963, partial [Sarracenia purpurea var. burkii]